MAQLTQSAIVLTITDLTPQVRELTLLPKTHKILFQPGQWISLQLPIGINPPLTRAYSLATPLAPSGELTLAFDRVPNGVGSNYLYKLTPGDELQLSGPYGKFTLPLVHDREFLLISRYTGLVPIRCMLQQLMAFGALPQITLLAVGPAQNEWLYHNELLDLETQHKSFQYLPIVGSGTDQEVVEATLKFLRPFVAHKPKATPLLSGIKAFVRPLRAYFVEAGYDRRDVKIETYD